MKQPQSASHRVVMNTGILYAKMGITMFISLYTTRLILNSLGASDFGIFNIVGGAIAMLGFLNAAMASATQRFMSYSEGAGDKEKQKSIFNISVILHFFIAIIIGIVLLIAGYFFFHGILNIPAERIHAAQMVYYFMIISTMLTVMTVPYDAVLNAHENMLYYAIVGIIESVLKLAVAFVVVYTLADKLIIYGALMAGISLLVMVIMRVYCHKKYVECEFKPGIYYDKDLMREMTGFAGWSFLASTSSMIGQYGSGIVLNHFFGTILNAAQGIANQVSGQLITFSSSMQKALNPIIVKKEGEGKRCLAHQATFVSAKYSFLLLSFFAIPFIIETSYILKLWLKNVPEYTIIFCRLQVMRSLIEQLTFPISSFVYAQGNISRYATYKSILNILPVFLIMILFYYEYPPYIMYISWILFWGILGGITILYYAHKNGNMSYKSYITNVLKPCLCLFMIVFSINFMLVCIMDDNFFRLFMIIFLSSVFFIITAWKIIISKQEKYLFLQFYCRFQKHLSNVLSK
ncbi:hypothetical protein FACS1894182_06370 [Bacteroidia bacterium]|nr:hypothetical protein FACS1894182_06370 [Bacteroidia bacterium]